MLVENLNRKQIAIVSIVLIYCFVYFLLGIFPIVTFFSPDLSPYFNLSPWFFVIFYVLLVVSPLFRRFGKFRFENSEWLRLHYVFCYLELFLPILFIVPLIVYTSLTPNLNTKELLMIWFLLFMIFFQTIFRWTKNAVGMNYGKKGIPSLYRASAFATLSRLRLERKDERGVEYLRSTLTILKENLNQKKKDLKLVGETVSAIDTISLCRQKIPYEQLLCLAEKLEKLPVLDGVAEELRSFVNCREIKWTLDFLGTPMKTRRERISAYLQRYLLPIAVFVVTALGILPETTRTWLVNAVQELEWTQVIGFFVVIFLMYPFLSSYISLESRGQMLPEYDDIREMSKLQRERRKKQNITRKKKVAPSTSFI